MALSAADTIIGPSSITIAKATVTLPPSLGGATIAGTVTITSTGLAATFPLANQRLTVAGLAVSADHIALTANKPSGDKAPTTVSIVVVGASATLPKELGGLTLTGNLTTSRTDGGATIYTGRLAKANTRLSVGGFTTDVRAITLDGAGIALSGASLTLPHEFDVEGRAVVLTGALSLSRDASGKYHVDGRLNLRAPSFSVDGFGVTADTITLSGSDGLAIVKPTLSLPRSLASLLGVSTISLQKVVVDRRFAVIAEARALTFSLAGATVSSGPIEIATDGLAMPKASVTLPKTLGGGTMALPKLTAAKTGAASGASDKPLMFKIRDLTVNASGFAFKDKAIVIARLTVSLPALQDKVALQGLSYDGRHLSINGGGANIKLPTIKAGNFTIDATASLAFTMDRDSFRYDFVGTGAVYLAGLGRMSCAIELGSTDDAHPSNLYKAELDLQLGRAGLPIPGTPLRIVGGSGGIRITAQYKRIGSTSTPIPGTTIYAIKLGVDLQTDDGGYTFKGSATASVASDGNFGFGSKNASLLRFFAVSGGFCVRIVAQPDAVCQSAMAQHGAQIDRSASTGFYAEVSIAKQLVRNGRVIDIGGSAYAHIWRDGDGPELAAVAEAHLKIPESAIVTMVPPFAVSAGAHAEIGKFRGNGGVRKGVKAGVSAQVDERETVQETIKNVRSCDGFWDCLKAIGHLIVSYTVATITKVIHLSFDKTIFVGSDGSFEWSNAGGYSLIDPALQAANIGHGRLTGAPAHGRLGQAIRVGLGTGKPFAMARTAITVAPKAGAVTVAPSEAPTVTIPLTVLPGQHDAVFVLSWRSGAPTMAITGPSGNTFRPAGGADTTTDPHLLTGGDAGATHIAFPWLRPGRWVVTVGNLHGGEGYRFTMYATTPLPTLSVATPSTGTVSVANPRVTLSGALVGDRTLGRTVSLFYGTALRVQNGTAIATGVPLAGGAWRYTWDASAVPAGLYYVYAVLDDGIGPNVVGHAVGTVRVIQPARPAVPGHVVAWAIGGQLAVSWTPPTRRALIIGYRLYWRNNTMPGALWDRIDLGMARSFSLAAARPGVRYQVAVAAVDVAGHESARRTALMTRASTYSLRATLLRIRAGGQGSATLTAILTTRGYGLPHDPVALAPIRVPRHMVARVSPSTIDVFAVRPNATVRVGVDRQVRPGVYRLWVRARQASTGAVTTVQVTVRVTS